MGGSFKSLSSGKQSKAWTSESMMPWIRAESQSEVLLSTSRTTSTPILVDFCRGVWRDTRIEVGVSKYIEVYRSGSSTG